MVKIVTLIALTFIILIALLRFVAGKNRVCDRYIQRDYEKFKRLDAKLEQETTAIELSAEQQPPGAMK